MSEYSQALILKTINYFQRRYDFSLSETEAVAYLDSYARLTLSLPAGPDGLPSPVDGQGGRAAGAS